MRVDLEAKDAQQLKCPPYALNRDAALIQVKDLLVKRLDTHLHLGATQAANQHEGCGRDRIGARLDYKAHHTMTCALVFALPQLELIERGRLGATGQTPRSLLPYSSRNAWL